jgi:GNAT superfamily N-acetyltransferase
MPRNPLRLRKLLAEDAAVIAAAFAGVGWSNSVEQFLSYVDDQRLGIRQCWVALWDGALAGHVTLHRNPLYLGIAGKGIPEIQDLKVLPEYRRRGVATALLDRAERSAAAYSNRVAIGVGLHPGYNAAQRLYGQRGYVPDGLGVTYGDRFVQQGELVPFDDDLVLHFAKVLF